MIYVSAIRSPVNIFEGENRFDFSYNFLLKNLSATKDQIRMSCFSHFINGKLGRI